MEDREAICRLREGDLNGLEALVRRYQVQALRAAFLVTRDVAMAEDVVQETFLRLARSADRLDPARPIAPYLFRSVINAALNALRDEKRAVGTAARLVEAETLLQRAESVESEVQQTLLAEAVQEALTHLTPRQRAVIVQRYYLEMNEREMAHALGVSQGTIKRLLYNARAHLRHLLHREECES